MSPRQDQQKPVGQFLLQPRFEVIPMKGVEEEAGFLPAGAIVPVTVSPRKGLDATFVLSEHLAARGFRVIPHLSARLVRNREHLRDILEYHEGQLLITSNYSPQALLARWNQQDGELHELVQAIVRRLVERCRFICFDAKPAK